MLLTELETKLKEITEVNLDARFDVIILDSESGLEISNDFFAVDVCYDYAKVFARVNLDTCPICRQFRDYIQSFGYVNNNEKHELNEWVADGNSVFDNPYDICDDTGNPIDFITGHRLIIDMCNYHSNSSYYDQNIHLCDELEDLPF
jgi:hypothetical protein